MLRSATSEDFASKSPGQAPPSAGFDMVMALVSLWLIVGLYLDGWAHTHLDSALETFFTPWHAVIYSGFAACSLALVAFAGRNRRKGFAWRRSLPTGYVTSVTGAFIFASGALLDMSWHLAFGVEDNFEALLSPPHFFLVGGGVLIISGPLRAAWNRVRPLRGVDWLPAVLSLTLTYSVFTFMTQFAHFIVDVPTGVRPTDELSALLLQSQNVMGYIFQSVLLLGVMLLVLRRWGRHLPAGFFTVLLGLNMVGMVFMTDEYRLIPAGFAAGVVADVLAKKLRPSLSNVRGTRLFCFAVPSITTMLMFLTWFLTDRVWWSMHMWTGAIFMTGIAGLILSYLVVPPWPGQITERS